MCGRHGVFSKSRRQSTQSKCFAFVGAGSHGDFLPQTRHHAAVVQADQQHGRVHIMFNPNVLILLCQEIPRECGGPNLPSPHLGLGEDLVPRAASKGRLEAKGGASGSAASPRSVYTIGAGHRVVPQCQTATCSTSGASTSSTMRGSALATIVTEMAMYTP